jgi:hypothetical protein
MTKTARAARFRALFSAAPDGGVIWRDRAADDFSALGLSRRGADAAAADWTATKAGRPPQWRDGPGGLTCRADRAPAALGDICAALGIDLAQAETAARAAMTAQRHTAARALVRRLCALDAAGRIAWAPRTESNAPKTPPDARDRFNRTWAGLPLPVRHGEITIQRQRIDHAQALEWLTTAKPDHLPQRPADADLLDLWQPVAATADIPAPGLHPEYVLHCATHGLDPAQTADHLQRVCAQCAAIPADTLAAMVLTELETE